MATSVPVNCLAPESAGPQDEYSEQAQSSHLPGVAKIDTSRR